MSNEFFTVDGACANLVPSGPGYEGISIANQACPTVGSIPGQSTVPGSRYILLSYEYAHKFLWRVRLHDLLIYSRRTHCRA
jgi:ATP-binding cassette, subfamily G (WHITE), member 2, SNQ2